MIAFAPETRVFHPWRSIMSGPLAQARTRASEFRGLVANGVARRQTVRDSGLKIRGL